MALKVVLMFLGVVLVVLEIVLVVLVFLELSWRYGAFKIIPASTPNREEAN